MNLTIYRATDFDDDEIVSRLTTDNDEELYDEVKAVAVSDVTLDELADSVDSELEDQNRHSLSGVGEYMAKKFAEFLGEEKAKELLWSICQEKGFGWRF